MGYRGATSIRINRIDTPETVSPSTPDECYGAKASAAAARMLQGRRVELVFDTSQGRTDKYGRTLATFACPNAATSAGDDPPRLRGRVHLRHRLPQPAHTYIAAEQRAQAADRGLWGACGGPDIPLHTPRPVAPNPSKPSGNCEPGYYPCVQMYPPDVDCADVEGPSRSQDPTHTASTAKATASPAKPY